MAILFSPIWPTNLTAMRLRSGKVAFTSVGREKKCTKCLAYWPADNEFYHTNPASTDGLQYWCKACCAEWKQNKKRNQKENQTCIY